MYMEAVLGTCLYNCLYLKLAKMLCLSCYLLCFLVNKIGEEGRTSLPGSWWGEGRGREGGGQGREMVQTMYTHMNKCINNQK
jgi:hypothetical protein